MADVARDPTAVAPASSRAAAFRRDGIRFGVLLAIVVVVGCVVRAIYTLEVAPHTRLFPDSLWYRAQALNLRAGRGYVDVGGQLGAFRGLTPRTRATAYWPPLYPGYLAVGQTLFGESVRGTQLLGCVTGAATVAFTGLLGRTVAGSRVGLLGALLVALSPSLIAADGSLMAETLSVPLVVLAALLAQRARTRSTIAAWCALGATIGLATLTRGDGLFLIGFLMVPAALLTRVPARELWPRVLAGLGVTALVLAPWIVRNAIEVGEPAISTMSASGVLAAANCDATYSGSAIGSWSYACMRSDLGYSMSEARYASYLRRKGVDYALDHVERWPAVGLARVGRVWGVWDPRDLTEREARESRNLSWQRMAWPVSLATLVVGWAGFVVLARRRCPIALLVAPVAMTTLLALGSYGNPRFRTGAEPMLLIGVAAALLAAYDGVRNSGGTSTLPK